MFWRVKRGRARLTCTARTKSYLAHYFIKIRFVSAKYCASTANAVTSAVYANTTNNARAGGTKMVRVDRLTAPVKTLACRDTSSTLL
jgi:hypothetical protein